MSPKNNTPKVSVLNSYRVLAGKFAAIVAIAIAGTSEARAQDTSGSASQEENETVKLSDFVVTSSATTGYGETNSYTATRVGLPIIDTPLSIEVVTSQQLKDQGVLSFMDAFTYTSNISGDASSFEGISGGGDAHMTERGFSMLVLRDGFIDPVNLNSENADRIEIIKGPDTVFFGAASPGGIINVISKKPEHTPSGSIDYTYGSYGYSKVRLDVTGPLTQVSNVDFRIFAEYQDSGGWIDYTYARSKIVTPSFTWKPLKNLSINVQYNYDYEHYNELGFTTFGSNEFLNDYANPPQAILNYLGLTAAQVQARWKNNEVTWAGDVQAATGEVPYWLANYQPFLAPQGARFNPGGPDAYEQDVNNTLTVEMAYSLNDYISLRYGFLASNINSSHLLPGLGLNNGDGTIAINANAGFDNQEIITHQVDFLFKKDFSFLKNKLVVSYQYARNTEQTTNDLLDLAAYPYGGANALLFYNPYTMPPVRLSLIPLTPNPNGSLGSSNVIESGYTVSWASSWFNDRLNILAGVRFDKNQSAPLGLPVLNTINTKANLPMVGATYRIAKDVSFFASYSKTYTPTGQLSITGNGVTAADNPHVLPAETGSGYDIGLKVDALQGRLSGTFTVFQDERSGIASEDLAARVADPRNSAANGGFSGPESVDYFVAGGLERTQGVEADFIYKVTGNLLLLASGSYMPVARTITDPGTSPGTYDYDIEILGKRRIQNAPERMASLWAKYDFKSGTLKNLSIGAGVHYSSEVMDQENYLWYLENPSFVTLEGMVSYHLPIHGHDVTFRVNGKNLTNVTYFQGGIVQAPPREIFFNTELRF